MGTQFFLFPSSMQRLAAYTSAALLQANNAKVWSFLSGLRLPLHSRKPTMQMFGVFFCGWDLHLAAGSLHKESLCVSHPYTWWVCVKVIKFALPSISCTSTLTWWARSWIMVNILNIERLINSIVSKVSFAYAGQRFELLSWKLYCSWFFWIIS